MAEVIPPPDELAQIQHDAEWARAGQSFKGTSLADRRRQAVDRQRISDYESAGLAQAEMAELERAKTNKIAQDFHFRQEQLQQQTLLNDATLKIRHQTLRANEELLPLKVKAQEAQANLSITSEKAKLNSIIHAAETQAREINDTTNFRNAVTDAVGKFGRGSPEFAAAVASARASAPYVNPQYFDDVWKTTNSNRSAEDVIAEIQRAKQLLPNASVTASSSGKLSVTEKPEDQKGLQQRLSRLESLRSKPKLDKDQIDYLDEEINAVKARLSGGQSETQTTQTQQQPKAADPRIALAQKALNDPNASDAHKAAARKILGVQ